MIEIIGRKVEIQLICDCGEEFTEETEIMDNEEQIYVECPACGKSRNIDVKFTAEE